MDDYLGKWFEATPSDEFGKPLELAPRCNQVYLGRTLPGKRACSNHFVYLKYPLVFVTQPASSFAQPKAVLFPKSTLA